MPLAVRFDDYGEVDVLQVVEVDRPVPGRGEVLVDVRAAAVNPGEGTIRRGELADRWPSTFPSGQGSDLAGVVVELGEGAEDISVGDEVIGFVHNRSSHAELVAVEADHLILKPNDMPWEVAGSLFVVGTSAYASIRAIGLTEGETVAVSAAAGGVGSITVQWAKHLGATVIGIASEANHDWLTEHGVIPVAYGEGLIDRLRDTSGGKLDAFLDTFGADYVDIALELGVPTERINTLINFPAAQKYGVKTAGNTAAASAEVLAEVVELVAKGVIEVPIANVYPLTEVREAVREVERRHTRGKIVLKP